MKQLRKRHYAIERASVTQPIEDTEQSFVLDIAVSSTLPYRRKAGWEILSHSPESVDATRASLGAMPLLFQHDPNQYIGIVERFYLDGDTGRAVVRFSKTSPLARQVLADIQDGVLRSVSVSYDVKQVAEGERIDGARSFVATQWEVLEVSIVTIPADPTIGVYKSAEMNFDNENEMKIASITLEDGAVVTDPDEIAALLMPKAEEPPAAEAKAEESVAEQVEPAPVAAADEEVPEDVATETETKEQPLLTNDNNNVSAEAERMEQVTMNKEQIEQLTALAVRYGKTDQLATWISEQRSVESVKASLLDDKATDTTKIGAPALHLNKREKSFAGAVKAFLGGDNSEIAERGLEQARAFGTPINAGTLYLPTDVEIFSAAATKRAFAKRDATYGMGGTGANITGKDYLTFEETLREGSLLARLGGEVRTLNDIGSMPYFSTPSTASMYSETGSVSNASVEVGLRTWAPKRVAARYEFTNLVGSLNGTYDLEAELHNDLLAEGIRQFEAQVFGGTGANNQVTGVVYDSNIATMSSMSGSFAISSGSAMITEVANRNANVDAGAWVVSNGVYGNMYSQPVFGAGSGQSVLQVLQASNPVYRTNHLPRPIAGKEVAVFGDWSKVTAATFGPVVRPCSTLNCSLTAWYVIPLHSSSGRTSPSNVVT
jgi:HK97 family phage prohead protease